ncbi:hypothetical protein ACFLWU_03910 [Chloroflexota bacterium]
MKKLTCPECGSRNLMKQGVIWSGRSKVQQYGGKDCGRNTIHPLEKDLVLQPV